MRSVKRLSRHGQGIARSTRAWQWMAVECARRIACSSRTTHHLERAAAAVRAQIVRLAAVSLRDEVSERILIRPGVPRCAVRTARPRLVRVPSAYSTHGPGGKPPCASGTYPTQEAGTRSLYAPNGGGGPGAYASAQGPTGRARTRKGSPRWPSSSPPPCPTP